MKWSHGFILGTEVGQRDLPSKEEGGGAIIVIIVDLYIVYHLP